MQSYPTAYPLDKWGSNGVLTSRDVSVSPLCFSTSLFLGQNSSIKAPALSYQAQVVLFSPAPQVL